MNVVVDATYLISEISTNFHRLVCKKCEVAYYVINYGAIKSMIIG